MRPENLKFRRGIFRGGGLCTGVEAQSPCATAVNGHGRLRNRRLKRGLVRKPIDLGLRARPEAVDVDARDA